MADSSSKDLQQREKDAIGDEEKQKHAKSKLVKLEKTLKEVSILCVFLSKRLNIHLGRSQGEDCARRASG